LHHQKLLVVAAAVEAERVHQVAQVVEIMQSVVQLVQALQDRVFQVEHPHPVEVVAAVE
jgi:hypothetical protein